jgi:hypothetical protein
MLFPGNDGKSLHGIHHPDSNVFIPFHFYGCISYFSTQLQSDKEINQCRWITFTSDAECQPYSDHFSTAEKAAKDYFQYPDPMHLHFNHNGEHLNDRMIKSTILMDNLIDPAYFTFKHTFDSFMAATSSTIHPTNIPKETLARRWGTSTNTAGRTLKQTTQLGLRYLQGLLDRWF